MADIVFIALTLAFFGACVAYVRGLDRLVRGAEEPDLAVVGNGPDGPAVRDEVGEVAA